MLMPILAEVNEGEIAKMMDSIPYQKTASGLQIGIQRANFMRYFFPT